MDLSFLLIKIPAILLGITIHEYAHGMAAFKLGDTTARDMGRLTLNPISHLDIMGFLCLLLAGFGWAKPVPIDASRFRDPQRGMLLSSAAGPLANLACAFAAGAVLRWLGDPSGGLTFLLALVIFYNVVLAVFNLLPIPPLDGSHILKGLMPLRWAREFSRYDRVMTLALFGVIILDAFLNTGILSRIIFPPILRIYGFIGGHEGMMALMRIFGIR